MPAMRGSSAFMQHLKANKTNDDDMMNSQWIDAWCPTPNKVISTCSQYIFAGGKLGNPSSKNYD